MAEIGNAAYEAIRDSLAEENGYITGFLAIVTYIDGDGDTGYAILMDPQQSIPTTIGIQRMLDRKIDFLVDEAL
jgi:hypothetical protein